MKTKPQFRGSIILMHDGGGDRSVTVAALPVLIDGLRAHGYAIVQVSDLMGKTRAEVMPPLERPRTMAGAGGFGCLLRLGLLQPLCRQPLLSGRRPDERPA